MARRRKHWISPLQPGAAFYTPWKHQKTFRFFDGFRGYRKATPGCNMLKKTCISRSLIIITAFLLCWKSSLTSLDEVAFHSVWFLHIIIHMWRKCIGQCFKSNQCNVCRILYIVQKSFNNAQIGILFVHLWQGNVMKRFSSYFLYLQSYWNYLNKLYEIVQIISCQSECSFKCFVVVVVVQSKIQFLLLTWETIWNQ